MAASWLQQWRFRLFLAVLAVVAYALSRRKKKRTVKLLTSEQDFNSDSDETDDESKYRDISRVDQAPTSYLGFLRNACVFGCLEEAECILLHRLLDIKTVPPDTTIFRQGGSSESLVIVVEGKLGLYATAFSSAGMKGSRTTPVRLSLVNELSRGDSTGDLDVVDARPRLFTAKTITTCTLATLKRADFASFFTKHPQAFQHYVQHGIMRLWRIATFTLHDFLALPMPATAKEDQPDMLRVVSDRDCQTETTLMADGQTANGDCNGAVSTNIGVVGGGGSGGSGGSGDQDCCVLPLSSLEAMTSQLVSKGCAERLRFDRQSDLDKKLSQHYGSLFIVVGGSLEVVQAGAPAAASPVADNDGLNLGLDRQQPAPPTRGVTNAVGRGTVIGAWTLFLCSADVPSQETSTSSTASSTASTTASTTSTAGVMSSSPDTESDDGRSRSRSKSTGGFTVMRRYDTLINHCYTV
jgi:hypothetical protein